MQHISIQELFDKAADQLGLNWVAGQEGGNRLVVSEPAQGGLSLIGHLNLVNPNQIQILGPAEINYLSGLSQAGLDYTVNALFSDRLAALVIAGGEPVPSYLFDAARRSETPLFTSAMPSAMLMDQMRHVLVQALAEMTSMHGVFMEVQGMGVLITGSSAIGKSELALELISRGHRLIADDIVDFYRVSPDTIEGRCPPLLQDFLEVRGLGILNVRALFGETAVKPKKNLKLIVQLAQLKDLPEPDRLTMSATTQNILEIAVPKVSIPVTAGTNIAVLLEVAVRNHILLLRGINSTQQFMERHQQEIERNGNSRATAQD